MLLVVTIDGQILQSVLDLHRSIGAKRLNQ